MRRLQLLAQQLGLESDADEVLPEVVVQVVGNAALLARASLDYLALGQVAFCHLQLQAGVLLLNDCLELVALLPEEYRRAETKLPALFCGRTSQLAGCRPSRQIRASVIEDESGDQLAHLSVILPPTWPCSVEPP